MTLPSTYPEQNCSLARALEIVGERWTLLIIRDAFYGVRRFGDFATQLGIPRAVLTARLKALVDEGILVRERDQRGAVDYRLTAKGQELWPVMRMLMGWGDKYYSPAGPKRIFRHEADGGLVDEEAHCTVCGSAVPLRAMRVERGAGFDPSRVSGDAISRAIDEPRLLLEPLG
ncbi:winged helix-turn-helix transcriptional regulator [Gryllotalpicola reticulitermitis]|uniref:Winged helix-turn-helix transcriptional regulator n=1 Tax=Gryllotalpicola reticulitermitis TaxID=1184153 RepID=A0ABV8QAM4_9MICO